VNDTSTCTCPSGDGPLRHPCPTHPLQRAQAQPAAAQEAVDFYVCDDCGHHYMEDGITCDCSSRSTPGPLRHVRMVPVAAAPVLDPGLYDWLKARDLVPDGHAGQIDMAEVVEALNEHERQLLASTPAAPGIDLEQFRELEGKCQRIQENRDFWHGVAEKLREELFEAREELAKKIDASPKGGSDWEATDADISAWVARNDLGGSFGTKTDARAAFEDARSAEQATSAEVGA